MSLFKRTPPPIVAPWAVMEKPVLQLGVLGKEGAIKEYVLSPPPDYPGQIVVRWCETKRRKTGQQAFAVREASGPQCPHCTALQLFTALATTAAGATTTTMTPHVAAYKVILKGGSTPTYTITLEDGAWTLDCRAQQGSAHTKYDCDRHR